MLDFLGKVGQASGPLQQILAAIKGPSKPKAPPSEQTAKALLLALAQPNNSLVKTLAEEEFRNMRNASQMDIQSRVLADRRERSMGRAPVFFDPERADENIAYQISRGAPMLQQQAQKSAIQRILQAAGVKEFAGPEALREQEYQKTVLNQGGVPGRIDQGLKGLEQILKIFRGGQQPPDTPGIQWNQPSIKWY